MRHAISFLTALISVGPALADEPDGISFSSVDEAWVELSVKPGVTIEYAGIWRVIYDKSELSVWTFTAPDNPAHPSVVRRVAFEKGGAWHITSFIMCGVDKDTCDRLRDDFAKLNEQAAEYGRRRAQEKAN